ncbi:MAG: chorismate-binding protein [Bdellovibrionales bacterium]
MALNVEKLLRSGAFFRRSDGRWILGWGNVRPCNAPTPGKLAFFSPQYFSTTENSWFEFENVDQLQPGELQKMLEFDPQPKMRSVSELKQLAGLSRSGGFQLSEMNWQQADKSQFESDFNQIMQKINQGELEKAVPITYEWSPTIPDEPLIKKILHRLLITQDGLTPYGMWSPEGGLLGCTPELLLEVKSGILKTMAVAGTRPSDSNKSLLENKKELHEHGLVVEGLKQLLSSLGKMNVSETYEWNIGLITHLRTDVEIQLDTSVNPSELVLSLHPTPALGGVPRAEALGVLKDLPSANIRRKFGAPFGVYLENGDMEVVVAIRNILWDDEGTKLFSGCGVVSESQFEMEWNELYAKRVQVKSTLGLG